MPEAKAQELADALAAGGVCLAPTDTVYGLIAKPDRPSAVERIFLLKKRPPHMNLQALLPSDADPADIGAAMPAAVAELWARVDLRPKATFILPLDDGRKPAWLRARNEIGVRVPADDRIQALLRLTGPLLATSANAHGQPPGRTVPEILAQLDGAPAAIWDAGQLGGEASTVINFNVEPPTVLRWGALQDLEAFGLGHDR